MTRLSIVVPVLNEEATLPELYRRLSDVASKLDDVETEIVFVDDGSTDRSAAVIGGLRGGPHVRLVRLSRNFGSWAALPCGLDHATGDVIGFMSADLQDPPEILVEMVDRWRSGYEIVFATRKSREDPWSSKILASMYYWMIRRIALPQMPSGGTDLCLVDRRVVKSVGNLRERNSNLFYLLMWSGFRQCTVPYHRTARKAGVSRHSFARKIKLFIDWVVAFSFFPMRLISAFGGLLSVLGLGYAAIVVLDRIVNGTRVEGWASLMVVLLLCSGVQLLMLGILSEYLWRALEASRNRPTYVVREVIENGDAREETRPQSEGVPLPARDAGVPL